MLLLLTYLALRVDCAFVSPETMVCRQVKTRAVVQVVEAYIVPAQVERDCFLLTCSDDGLVCRKIWLEDSACR